KNIGRSLPHLVMATIASLATCSQVSVSSDRAETRPVLFSGWFPVNSPDLQLTFLCGPLLIWVAFRLSPREVATANVVLSGWVLWGTLRGLGPFVRPSPQQSLLLQQTFLGVLSLMALVAAVAVAERKRAESAVLLANEALEHRVAERTATLQQTNNMLSDRIRQHQTTEDALRRSDERYRQLFESANDAIYTTDLQGFFTSINRAGERISGYSRDEAPSTHIDDIVAPEYLTLARQMFAR